MISPLRFSARNFAIGYIALSIAVLALFATPLWFEWTQRIQGLPGDAVAGVDLDPPGLQQLAAGIDELVTLDLLGVTAGRREHEHREAEVAPPRQREVVLRECVTA